jgi:hypothetical protein
MQPLAKRGLLVGGLFIIAFILGLGFTNLFESRNAID